MYKKLKKIKYIYIYIINLWNAMTNTYTTLWLYKAKFTFIHR